MSHYLVAVLLDPKFEGKSDEIQAEVHKALEPFNEHTQVEPYKNYLDEDDIKSGVEHYGNEEALIKYSKEWSGSQYEKDEQGIFYMSTYNPKSKWDWYRIGGRWNGGLTNNTVEIEDEEATAIKKAQLIANGEDEKMLEFTGEHYVGKPNPKYNPIKAADAAFNNSCLVSEIEDHNIFQDILTPDGEWHSVGRMGWFGARHNENEEWPKKKMGILAELSFCLAVAVDLHI